MSNETLAAVYQDTINLYGQVASNTLNAYQGVAQRAITGIDSGITKLLSNERLSFLEPLQARLTNAKSTVSGAIETGLTKYHSDALRLVQTAVNTTNNGIEKVAGFADKFDERFPQIAPASSAARDAGLPAARLTRGVVRLVANGVETLAQKVSGDVQTVVDVKPAARKAPARKAAGRKTGRRAA